MSDTDWIFLACSAIAFVYSVEQANDAKNWPTALMWALLALACVLTGVARVSGLSS